MSQVQSLIGYPEVIQWAICAERVSLSWSSRSQLVMEFGLEKPGH
jgi:hypothetical protein